jgi:hypothetical protein
VNNWPKAWHGQYCGTSHDPTIVLETVDWRTCGFGTVFLLSGSVHDINILHRSHLFARLASGDVPAFNYKVNGHDKT